MDRIGFGEYKVFLLHLSIVLLRLNGTSSRSYDNYSRDPRDA